MQQLKKKYYLRKDKYKLTNKATSKRIQCQTCLSNAKQKWLQRAKVC